MSLKFLMLIKKGGLVLSPRQCTWILMLLSLINAFGFAAFMFFEKTWFGIASLVFAYIFGILSALVGCPNCGWKILKKKKIIGSFTISYWCFPPSKICPNCNNKID